MKNSTTLSSNAQIQKGLEALLDNLQYYKNDIVALGRASATPPLIGNFFRKMIDRSKFGHPVPIRIGYLLFMIAYAIEKMVVFDDYSDIKMLASAGAYMNEIKIDQFKNDESLYQYYLVQIGWFFEYKNRLVRIKQTCESKNESKIVGYVGRVLEFLKSNFEKGKSMTKQ